MGIIWSSYIGTITYKIYERSFSHSSVCLRDEIWNFWWSLSIIRLDTFFKEKCKVVILVNNWQIFFDETKITTIFRSIVMIQTTFKFDKNVQKNRLSWISRTMKESSSKKKVYIYKFIKKYIEIEWITMHLRVYAKWWSFEFGNYNESCHEIYRASFFIKLEKWTYSLRSYHEETNMYMYLYLYFRIRWIHIMKRSDRDLGNIYSFFFSKCV